MLYHLKRHNQLEDTLEQLVELASKYLPTKNKEKFYQNNLLYLLKKFAIKN